MTIEELMDAFRDAIRHGRVSAEDEVLIRNPAVSMDAMSAGSNGYAAVAEVLIIGKNSEGMTPGIYLNVEEEDY
jgi:hypothetical protein